MAGSAGSFSQVMAAIKKRLESQGAAADGNNLPPPSVVLIPISPGLNVISTNEPVDTVELEQFAKRQGCELKNIGPLSLSASPPAVGGADGQIADELMQPDRALAPFAATQLASAAMSADTPNGGVPAGSSKPDQVQPAAKSIVQPGLPRTSPAALSAVDALADLRGIVRDSAVSNVPPRSSPIDINGALMPPRQPDGTVVSSTPGELQAGVAQMAALRVAAEPAFEDSPAGRLRRETASTVVNARGARLADTTARGYHVAERLNNTLIDLHDGGVLNPGQNIEHGGGIEKSGFPAAQSTVSRYATLEHLAMQSVGFATFGGRGNEASDFQEPAVVPQLNSGSPDLVTGAQSGGAEQGHEQDRGSSANSPLAAGVDLSDRIKAYDLIENRLATAMGQQIAAQVTRGVWEMNFRLHPAELGHVDVRLGMADGQLGAVFSASSANTQALIEQGFDRLRVVLNDAGFRVASLGIESSSAQMGGGQRGAQGYSSDLVQLARGRPREIDDRPGQAQVDGWPSTVSRNTAIDLFV